MSQDIHQVLKRIAEALEDADGEVVAGIYNQLYEDQIVYVGDSMFDATDTNPLIKVRLSNPAGEETVEFRASDVLAYYTLDCVWSDLSEQCQNGYAEDYAIHAFERKFGGPAQICPQTIYVSGRDMAATEVLHQATGAYPSATT